MWLCQKRSETTHAHVKSEVTTVTYLSTFCDLSQLMRLWYLSHRWPVKAQASLRIRLVIPEPSLFAHMKYGSRRRVQPKFRHLLRMCVWRVSLRRTKNTIISWAGSFYVFFFCSSFVAGGELRSLILALPADRFIGVLKIQSMYVNIIRATSRENLSSGFSTR